MITSRGRLAGLVLATVLVLPACGVVRRWREPGAPAPIDINTASVRKVEQLPGVTPNMAGRIVSGRPYDDLSALVERGILTERELDRIRDRAVVKGHDR